MKFCPVLPGPASVILRVYNLISVPQITWLLLGDAKILTKTDPRNGSKKEKRSYGKVKNNKNNLNNKAVLYDAFAV